MSRRQKFLDQLLAGQSDRTLDFSALCALLLSFGFVQRIRGSHYIFGHVNVVEIINLQLATDGTVKPYQAKQVRELLLRYNLLNSLPDEPTPTKQL
ncbi:MAG: hypothetical protein ACRYFZ_25315 [Janthinobacterium lividum]